MLFTVFPQIDVMHYESLYGLRLKYVRAYTAILARGRNNTQCKYTTVEIPMVEIPRYKSVPGVTYLEASAIRRHAAQFNYIFSGVPREFAEETEPHAITFSCHFANIVPDRRIFRGVPWKLPWLDLSVGRKQNRPAI